MNISDVLKKFSAHCNKRYGDGKLDKKDSDALRTAISELLDGVGKDSDEDFCDSGCNGCSAMYGKLERLISEAKK